MSRTHAVDTWEAPATPLAASPWSRFAESARIQDWAAAGWLLLLPYVIYFFAWSPIRTQTLANDHLRQVPGQQLLFMQNLRDGYFPLWAPGDCGGSPFAVYLISQAYSPVTWLMYFVPSVYHGLQLDILDMIRLGLLGVSGFYLYRLCRCWSLSWVSGVVTACTFMFNLRTLDMMRSGSPLDTCVWLPVLLYLAEQITRKPGPRIAALYAMAQYMLLITGHTQNAFYSIVFLNVYFLVRNLWAKPESHVDPSHPNDQHFPPRIFWFAAAQASGLALAAVMLVPTVMDMMPLWTHRTVPDARYYHAYHMDGRDLVANMVYPWLASVYSTFYASQCVWLLMIVGVVACLSDHSPQSRSRRRMTVFLGLSLVLCVLYSLGPLTPVNEWVHTLCPQMRTFRGPGRIMVIGSLAMALISGLAMEQLLHSMVLLRRVLPWITAGCGVFLMAGVVMAAFLGTGQMGWTDPDALHHYATLPIWGVVSKYAPANMGCYRSQVLLGLMSGTLIGIACLNLLLFQLLWQRRASTSTIGMLLLGGMLIEASVYHRFGAETIPQRYFTPQSARFKDLDLYHTRIYEPSNLFMFSYKNVAKTKVEVGDCKKSGEMLLAEETPGMLREFLNQGGSPAWWIYYQNVRDHAIPRAYLTPAVNIVDRDDLAAIREMDPYTYSVLDTRHPANSAAIVDPSLETVRIQDPPGKSEAAAEFARLNANVHVTCYTPNMAGFDVLAPQTAMFNYSDAWARGWRATVDGQAAHVYCTNHLFKGVMLSPGRHAIDFRYDPPSFRWGLIVSLAAACITLALLITPACTVPRGALIRYAMVAAALSPLAWWTHHRIYSAANRPGIINFHPDAQRPPAIDYNEYMAS